MNLIELKPADKRGILRGCRGNTWGPRDVAGERSLKEAYMCRTVESIVNNGGRGFILDIRIEGVCLELSSRSIRPDCTRGVW